MNIKKYTYGVLLSVCSGFLIGQNMSTLVDTVTAQKGIALIVITDSGDSDGPANSMRSLSAHPDILPYRITLAIQNSNSRLATELKTQTIWENRQSGWAVIGPDGKLIIARDALPDLEAIKAILQNTNCPIPLIELQKFYRQNTNRIDIQMLVLEELVRIGEGKLLHFYGEQTQNPDFILPDERDDELWSEYARLFKTSIIEIISATNHTPIFMTVAEFRRIGTTFTGRILPSASTIRTSPNLTAMARAVLQQIEAELINAPYNYELERIWTRLRPNRGGMRIETFVDHLLQNRYRDQKPIPTSSIIYVLQREEKWAKITDLLSPIWDDLLEQSAKNTDTSRNLVLNENQWLAYVFPLFQAYVQSNSFGKAEEIIKTWIDQKGWSGTRDSARNFVLNNAGNLPNENWPN